jgi:Transglutaminase-like superfamily
VPQLLDAWDQGDRRLRIMCGRTAALALALMDRIGVPSRFVATLTKHPYDGSSDGHVLVEIKMGEEWVVYDPNSNRQPVDRKGRGVPITRLVNMRPFHWRFLAKDVFYEPDLSYDYPEADAAYDHAFGVALIEYPYAQRLDDPGATFFAYHHRGQRPRIQGTYGGVYKWVDSRTWAKLTGD